MSSRSATDWHYQSFYSDGWSARALLDAAVVGPAGERIGEVQNIIIGPDGFILSIIAEIGGVMDAGDTHVNVPWEEVQPGPGLESVIVPLTEETVERYSDFERRYLTADVAKDAVTSVTESNAFSDLDTGPRAWRVDELIGDYAVLRDAQGYGYVSDVIFASDGMAAAVIVPSSTRFGYGSYAYPHYGYGHGWAPASTRYRLPYTAADIGQLERFDYDRLTGN